jgi:hypothetical protein
MSYSPAMMVAGRAVEVTDPETVKSIVPAGDPLAGSHVFRVDISEAVHTRVGDPADHLVIESWREGHGVRRVERR